MLDFRNVNTLWSSVLIETLVCLGLKNAVVCPGSRSTPLTLALASHNQIKTVPVLDERSAVFFALGIAKKTHLPVALVCSSGTAGANFLPGVIEAQETGVSLIILTADRPPELRHCHAGQTIDQIKLYGNYPNWYTELAIPQADRKMLAYLRQNIVQAWEKSLFPYRGVVHLNCPFREPLAPITDSKIHDLKTTFNSKQFFSHLQKYSFINSNKIYNELTLSELKLASEGIIIAGLAQPKHPKKYCQEISFLSHKLQFPIIAEALSPLRNHASLNPNLITTYDTILRDSQRVTKLQPKVIIQLGELPTSKQLRQWLNKTSATRYVISSDKENFDPLHGKTIHLRTSVADFIELAPSNTDSSYLKTWCETEKQTKSAIASLMHPLETLYEGKAAWLISQHLPPQTPIFLANSMSVRNAEFFWQTNNSETVPYFNRGANGIDGTLSTALGIAHTSDRPAVMLTGDLALLHDTNGFLINKHFSGHLTIILINNNGGGIFEILPISQFDPPFEEYFATPQNVDFAQLCQTYNVEYQLITNWQQLPPLLNPLPTTGIRILEIKSDRKQDALFLQQLWQLRSNSEKQ